MDNYPKWVQRAPDIGPVLCQSADEEKQLLADWAKAQQPPLDSSEEEQLAKTQALLAPRPAKGK